MSAFDLLDDTFPHGTVEGHRRGCRGAVCPAPLACRDVKRRYDGDYGFKRLVDAGVPLEEILRRDAAEREGIEKRDREAARAAAGKPPLPTPKPKTTTAPRATRAAAPRPQRAMSAPAPVVDPIVEFDRDRDEWRARRRELRAGVRDAERAIAAATQRLADAREQLAAHLELAPVKPTPPSTTTRASRSETAAAAARLHAQQMTDASIAAELGITRNYVCTLRKEQGLEVHRAPRARRASSPRAPREPKPREVLGHGTNASYARGCRCDDCREAAAAYKKEWTEQRKRSAEAIPAENHGTPYGYQLGCRSRTDCPAEISCIDASLAEERRRRREAGAPEAAPRVGAEPRPSACPRADGRWHDGPHRSMINLSPEDLVKRVLERAEDLRRTADQEIARANSSVLRVGVGSDVTDDLPLLNDGEIRGDHECAGCRGCQRDRAAAMRNGHRFSLRRGDESAVECSGHMSSSGRLVTRESRVADRIEGARIRGRAA